MRCLHQMIAQKPFPWAKDDDGFSWCRVCGEFYWKRTDVPAEHHRCWRHVDRNPCVIDGCKRSTKARTVTDDQVGVQGFYRSNDLWFCSEHWRAFVPPGSPERRIYNRFFRLAKRYGWTPARESAFWRIWNRLVSRARARARGDIDMDEINRVMGW